MSLRGIVLLLSYRLRRHLLAGWSLSRWLALLLLAAGLAALIRWWANPWPAGLLGGLFLIYLLTLAWAARQRYVHFAPLSQADTLLHQAPHAPPLRNEELVPIRASGWFGVEGKNQYYVDIKADFETVGTREHIILGRVHPSRFLLLGRWPIDELGWWYIFFQPGMIRKLGVGHFTFGPRPQPALRVVYAPDEEKEEKVYLTFEDVQTLRRVWEDLLQDAPPGAMPQGNPRP